MFEKNKKTPVDKTFYPQVRNTPNLPFIGQFLSPKSYKINNYFLNYDIQRNREPLDIMSVRIKKLSKSDE